MDPLVSYVCPTFNRVEWVGECLQGLLEQTVREVEVIVVDDGSSDGTDELLQWFLDRDERVKVVTNATNLGAGYSRNLGNQMARAPIIGVCDSDDIYPTSRTEKILAWFKEHPESEVVNFPYVSVGYMTEEKKAYPGLAFDEKQFKENGAVSYFSHPTVAVKREVALAIPYHKETDSLTDDYQWVKDLMAAGKRIDFCPDEPLCGHRVLPKSMMAKHRGWSPDQAF